MKQAKLWASLQKTLKDTNVRTRTNSDNTFINIPVRFTPPVIATKKLYRMSTMLIVMASEDGVYIILNPASGLVSWRALNPVVPIIHDSGLLHVEPGHNRIPSLGVKMLLLAMK